MEVRKDIFISYRNDGIGNNFATRIANDLKQSGYSVYFNPDEARSGDFPERLKQAISVCKDFICIVTEDYIDQLLSNDKICWVRDELLCAKEFGKNIIPLLVNGTTMPRDASKLSDDLQFFPNIDAYVFPEQYISSPFSVLCDVLYSHNDGKNDLRDVYNSSKRFNPNLSIEEIISKAKNNDLLAMLSAGVYFYYGVLGKQDTRNAFFWLKKVSDSNCEYTPIADKLIARMYYSGSVPREEQSYKNAYKYHLKSSLGDSFSAGQVGYLQSIGCGCEFDYEKTEQYFLSVLDSLDNPRKDMLCRFYVDHGDFEKAAKIYEDMADSFPYAAYQLGLLYKRGVVCKPYKPDYFKASLYFQMAVENGYMPAARELASLYFLPTGSFKKDFIKAQKYFLIAAENGDMDAQYTLGYMCRYGHVKKDISMAIEYFEMAAKQGHVLSAANLGILYQEPEVHNYEKAFEYCKFAAECGDTPSEFVLGTMYLSGRGCEPNEDKAYLCFKHAAENGAPEAIVMLRQMDELGI